MVNDKFFKSIAEQLGIPIQSVKTVLDLFDAGSTLPFIARYRKDQTGGLDEVVIDGIKNLAKSMDEFDKRKIFILDTIKEQGKLSDVLRLIIENCKDPHLLEDLYLPYKQRRKTKADIARELGLEPLAKLIYNQRENNLRHVVARFINANVKSQNEALQGARDIIAEWINEDVGLRNRLRDRFQKQGFIQCKVVKSKINEAQKYRDYFAFSEKIDKCPSHRIMAIFRGTEEAFLRLSIETDEDTTLEFLDKLVVKFRNESGEQVILALKDSYKRLLQPSLETEFKNLLWEKAELESIKVFAENLRQLLLSAPLGSKRVLAIDPGIKTGCKVVCLDENGMLLCKDVVFLSNGKELGEKAGVILKQLCEKFKIEAIAIGDGTAGRESSDFVRDLKLVIPLFMVNEDGASVYSASEVAREEFPNEDITVRGTISIGRRLMDPLAELVKIDPKAIGVGQYQHDVNTGKLKDKLDQTVISCVNQVGVNVNTASKHLLSYVSGLGHVIAQNIIDYRLKNGKFINREQLKEVPRLGSKAYEQCAGFLRINNGNNPLDRSGVHPENYGLIKKMADDKRVDLEQFVGNTSLIKQTDLSHYITEDIGELTLKDIFKELLKPGLDPREEVSTFQFTSNIHTMSDLRVGMVLPGIVSNITAFGAFVDIGVKQDGLVHVSHLADRYIKEPNEVVKLQQKVLVKILEIDVNRKRIALSMKEV